MYSGSLVPSFVILIYKYENRERVETNLPEERKILQHQFMRMSRTLKKKVSNRTPTQRKGSCCHKWTKILELKVGFKIQIIIGFYLFSPSLANSIVQINKISPPFFFFFFSEKGGKKQKPRTQCKNPNISKKDKNEKNPDHQTNRFSK